MKEIPNKKFTETDSVSSLLLAALDAPPERGFDFAIMRARGRVEDSLKGVKDGDTIKLEDADYAAAIEAVKSVRWIKRGKHLIEFADMFGA